ncbi:hypothetical protein L873DRAFT_824440 [Choiromyces venosus 120613-1]|uniref:Uncharacterized protein n=1 Tax=Choiromyces venosus 120613-1 TaxID=1336337 RepID=A0A3N4K326_9PEZI|nr:hypothetical protein L873DRAFT_824440 [Choiromyces venosus 120613-1]
MKSIQYFHSSNDIMFSLIINLVTTIRRFIDVAIHIQVTLLSDLLCQGNNPLSQLRLLPQQNIQAQVNLGLRIILLINQLSLQLVKLAFIKDLQQSQMPVPGMVSSCVHMADCVLSIYDLPPSVEGGPPPSGELSHGQIERNESILSSVSSFKDRCVLAVVGIP